MRPLIARCRLGAGLAASRAGDEARAGAELEAAIASMREMNIGLWLGQAERASPPCARPRAVPLTAVDRGRGLASPRDPRARIWPHHAADRARRGDVLLDPGRGADGGECPRCSFACRGARSAAPGATPSTPGIPTADGSWISMTWWPRSLAYPCRRVVVTGGEPLESQLFLPLILELRRRGVAVEVETSGTLPAPADADDSIQWNVSLKLRSSGVPDARRIDPSAIADFLQPASMVEVRRAGRVGRGRGARAVRALRPAP